MAAEKTPFLTRIPPLLAQWLSAQRPALRRNACGDTTRQRVATAAVCHASFCLLRLICVDVWRLCQLHLPWISATSCLLDRFEMFGKACLSTEGRAAFVSDWASYKRLLLAASAASSGTQQTIPRLACPSLLLSFFNVAMPGLAPYFCVAPARDRLLTDAARCFTLATHLRALHAYFFDLRAGVPVDAIPAAR